MKYATVYLACILTTIAWLLFGSTLLAQDDAVALKIEQRFAIPEQGHLEFRQAWVGDMSGRSIQTEADVLQLLEELSALPFDDAKIQSWEFFKQVGLTKIERPPAKIPPGSDVKFERLPDWAKTTVDFDPKRFIQHKVTGGHTFIDATTPKATVNVRKHKDFHQVSHFEPTTSKRLDTGTMENLFLRKTFRDDTLFTRRVDGEREFWTWTGPKSKIVYVSRPGQDRIDAVYGIIRGRVNRCAFFLDPQPPKAPDGIWVPRLSLRLRPSRTEEISYHAALIDQADFATPVSDEAFQVPVEKGVTYHSKLTTTKMPFRLDNIAKLSPKTANDLITAYNHKKWQERKLKELEESEEPAADF